MEANLPDTLHKFCVFALFENPQMALPYFNLQISGRKCAAKHQPASVLRNVHKPTHACDAPGKGTHIHTPLCIHFHSAKHGNIQTASIIKIKLGWLINDRLRKMTAAKTQA